ncbi:Retrovirus-related Pol polyprotein from transposon 17.6 [Gossypium australe]|uniref:Retrovirus-related Pol polyprotein from transposon 17.6 n=1 Tax=Gossypium australe TaxID=47621 RepID=A0A5B6X155_9ROSI|nr:Retrovirus-related Pol polyprotein from transposon 17.6 [Gossypium australe]
MSRRRKIKVGEQVSINASCSSIISRGVPKKFKDPRSFTIPIEIESIHFNRALCDLGASIHPKSVLEDVLVKVCSFIIPIDFVVLDFEEDREIPILLGRPFLATFRSTIDLEKNELTMKINSETKFFKCGY